MHRALTLGAALVVGAWLGGCGTRTVDYAFSGQSKDDVDPAPDDMRDEDFVDVVRRPPRPMPPPPPPPMPTDLMCAEVVQDDGNTCKACFQADGAPVDGAFCDFGCKFDRAMESGRCVHCRDGSDPRACLRCLVPPNGTDECQLCAWTGTDGQALADCKRCVRDGAVIYDDCNVTAVRTFAVQKVF